MIEQLHSHLAGRLDQGDNQGGKSKIKRVAFSGSLTGEDPEHILRGRLSRITYLLDVGGNRTPERILERARQARAMLDELLDDFKVAEDVQ